MLSQMYLPGPMRTNARSLFQHPWYTKDFLNQNSWCENCDLPSELKTQLLLEKLIAREENLYKGQNVLDSHVKRMLQYVPPHNTKDSVAQQVLAIAAGNLSYRPAEAKYCSLITAYRIADALAFYRGKDSQCVVIRTIGGRSSSWNNWNALKDVKYIVENFLNAVRLATTKVSRKETFIGDALLRQMKELASIHGKSHISKIQNNLLVAAINLRCMWTDSKEDPSDLFGPSQEQLFKDYECSLDISERQALTTLQFQSIPMRRPLIIAANISPLALLLNLDLSKQRYSEMKIIEDSKSIGTHNFESLHKIERAIWEAVIEVAIGQVTAFEACIHLSESFNSWAYDIKSLADDPKANSRFVINTSTFPMPDNGEWTFRSDGAAAPCPDKDPAQTAPIAYAPLMRIEYEIGHEQETRADSPPLGVLQQGQSKSVRVSELNGTFTSLNHDSEEGDEDNEEEVAKSLYSEDKDDELASNSDNGDRERSLHQEDEDVDMAEAGGQDVEESEDGFVQEAKRKLTSTAHAATLSPGTPSGRQQKMTTQIRRNATAEDIDMAGVDPTETDDQDVDEGETVEEQRRELRLRVPKAKTPTPPPGATSSRRTKKNTRPRQDAPAQTNDKTAQSQSALIRWQTPFIKDEGVEDWIPEEPITLDLSQQVSKVQASTEWTLFDAKGVAHKRRPKAHHKETLEFYETILKAVESNYIDKKPPHAANSAESPSVFKVISHEEMERMSPSEKLELFSQGHILETDRPVKKMQFDKAGLRNLGRLRKVVTVQDQSIAPSTNQNDRLKKGTLLQMLDSARKPNDTGKILNALEFPMSLGDCIVGDLSTDLYAMKETFVKMERHAIYPARAFIFGLCGLRGAETKWHVDPEGAPTVVDPLTGEKWWIVYRAKDSQDPWQFAHISQFYSEHFDLDKPISEMWDIEAVLLTPGTRLYMRPNTVHSVLTMGHSICYGAHFYSTSTMQDTFYGIVHTFCADSLITNTSHPESRLLLRRIVQLYHLALVMDEYEDTEPMKAHIPDLKTVGSVMNLLSACSLAIFSNVLDFNTYIHPDQVGESLSEAAVLQMEQFDRNSMSQSDRSSCIYARGLALELMDWFIAHYEFAGTGQQDPVDTREMVMDHLAHQGYVIWLAKTKAEEQEVIGAPHCTSERVRLHLLGTLSKDSLAGKTLRRHLLQKTDTDDMYLDWSQWAVHRRQEQSVVWKSREESEIWNLGETSLDRKYQQGLDVQFHVDEPTRPMIGAENKQARPLKRQRRR